MSTPEPAAGLTRTVVRGAGIAGLGFASTLALNFGFYLVLARLATPSDFGVLAAGSLFVGLGMVFAESGMLAAVIQRRDRVEEAANTAFVSTVLGGVGLTLLALALAPLIGVVFGSHRIGEVAAALSGWLFLNLAAVVPNALLQRRFSFARRAFVEPAAVIAFGTTAVIACAAGLGVWGLVLGVYASGTAHLVLSWAFARWRPAPRTASMSMWRELVGFGRHIFASEVLIRIGTAAETLLLGRFVSPGKLGQYRYAYRIASIPFLGTVNVASYVLYPAFAHIATDEARFHAAFLRALRWLAVLVAPASLILLALGEPLAVLLLGERWRPAGQALMAMSGYALGGAAISVASEAFKASGNPAVLPRMHALWTGLAVLLMLALLPLGLIGIAIAVAAAAILVGIYALRRVAQVLGLSGARVGAELWPSLAAAAVMAAVVLPLEQLVLHADSRSVVVGLAILAGEVALGLAIYVAVLRLLAPATAEELTGMISKRTVA
jgi:O-antigen/teichoic acid export membrane protein